MEANEGVSNEEVRKRLLKLGLKLSDKRISDLFKNPFYCGVLVHKSLEGKVLEGNQEKLISKDIFLKANEVQSKNSHGFKMTVENKDISLKRFIRCEKCGEYMTGYIAHKNNKYYYKCRTKGCGVNKNAEELHDKFLILLDDYTIPLTPGVEHFLRKHTVAAFNRLNEEKADNTEKMKAQVLELQKKINRLEERFIEEEITKEMFLKYTEKAKSEKLGIEQEIEKSKMGCSNLQNIIEAATTFASKFRTVWDSSDYYKRQKLQFMLFPEGIFYDKKKDAVRTSRVNSVFSYFVELATALKEKKNGRNNLKIVSPLWWR